MVKSQTGDIHQTESRVTTEFVEYGKEDKLNKPVRHIQNKTIRTSRQLLCEH